MAFGQYGAYPTSGYQPPYQQYQQFQPQQFYPQQMPAQDQLAQLRAQQMPRPQENGMIWVLGVEGAKAYIIAPGTTLPLWDSQARKIYIKSVDANGVPQMQTINYEIEGEAPAVPPAGATAAAGAAVPADYVTRADLKDVMNEIDDLWKCIESLPKEAPKPTSRKTEKEARVNE